MGNRKRQFMMLILAGAVHCLSGRDVSGWRLDFNDVQLPIPDSRLHVPRVRVAR